MTTLRASSLDRVLACPGSLTLCAKVAPRAGEEAQEGTFLHHVAHSKLVQEHGAVGDPGPTPVAHPAFAFSHWIADWYVNTVKFEVPPQWSLEVEAALSYEMDGFILSGHIDCVAISPDATEAIGFDLKTGYDPVDVAEYNWQVLGYCCLLLQAYPTLRKIAFHIVQPRNDEDEGNPRMSSATIEGDVLASATATLCAHVKQALANSMQVETGPKQCKWCAAAMVCPAQLKLLEEMKATLTEEYIASLKETPDDATLVRWVGDGRSVARPIEDALELLKERIKAGGGGGATIKTRPGKYKVLQPVEFMDAAKRRLTEVDVAEVVTWSTTTLKARIAERTGLPKTSKKGESAQSVFDAEFRPLCEQQTVEMVVLP